MQIVDCGLRIADCGLRIADCGLWIVDCGLRRVRTGFYFSYVFCIFCVYVSSNPIFFSFLPQCLKSLSNVLSF